MQVTRLKADLVQKSSERANSEERHQNEIAQLKALIEKMHAKLRACAAALSKTSAAGRHGGYYFAAGKSLQGNGRTFGDAKASPMSDVIETSDSSGTFRSGGERSRADMRSRFGLGPGSGMRGRTSLSPGISGRDRSLSPVHGGWLDTSSRESSPERSPDRGGSPERSLGERGTPASLSPTQLARRASKDFEDSLHDLLSREGSSSPKQQHDHARLSPTGRPKSSGGGSAARGGVILGGGGDAAVGSQLSSGLDAMSSSMRAAGLPRRSGDGVSMDASPPPVQAGAGQSSAVASSSPRRAAALPHAAGVPHGASAANAQHAASSPNLKQHSEDEEAVQSLSGGQLAARGACATPPPHHLRTPGAAAEVAAARPELVTSLSPSPPHPGVSSSLHVSHERPSPESVVPPFGASFCSSTSPSVSSPEKRKVVQRKLQINKPTAATLNLPGKGGLDSNRRAADPPQSSTRLRTDAAGSRSKPKVGRK